MPSRRIIVSECNHRDPGMTVQIRQAVILCGGLGTRLGGLTRDTPKPLLPVDGTPFLQMLMQEITRYGIDRFLLLAAYKSEQFQDFAGQVAQALGRFVTVEVSIEPDQAGTGGALFHARERLDDAFYLFNGDTLLDVPLDALARKLADSRNIGCLALRYVPDASRYGVVDVDADRIVRFGRASLPGEAAWINGGVAAFRRSFVDRLQPRGAFEVQALPDLANEGALAAVKAQGFFIDIGVPADFERGQIEIPNYRRRPAVFFDKNGVVNLDHGHVGQVERFEWVPGAREAIALVNSKGFYAFLVTNQASIAKGLYSEADHHALSRHMRAGLSQSGAWFDDERHCPCHLDGVDPAYRKASDWRKLEPGMLLDLMRFWPVDKVRSVMIGDRDSDMKAAAAAGIAGRQFTGEGPLDEFVSGVLDDLLERGGA